MTPNTTTNDNNPREPSPSPSSSPSFPPCPIHFPNPRPPFPLQYCINKFAPIRHSGIYTYVYHCEINSTLTKLHKFCSLCVRGRLKQASDNRFGFIIPTTRTMTDTEKDVRITTQAYACRNTVTVSMYKSGHGTRSKSADLLMAKQTDGRDKTQGNGTDAYALYFIQSRPTYSTRVLGAQHRTKSSASV